MISTAAYALWIGGVTLALVVRAGTELYQAFAADPNEFRRAAYTRQLEKDQNTGTSRVASFLAALVWLSIVVGLWRSA